MNPVRILYTIPELCIGGVEWRLISLASRLDAQRFRPAVAVLRPNGRLEGEARRLGLEVIHAPRRWRFDMGPAFAIARLVRRRGIQVVHSFLFLDNFYARLGAALGRAPVQVSSLAGVDYAPGSPNHAVDRALQPLATCVAANSEFMAAYARQHGLNRAPLRVIHNGVDVGRFRPGGERAAARKALGLPGDAFVVGISGRLVPPKDHATFLHAAALVAHEAREARFVVAGDGPLREELEAQSQQLGLEGKVRFLGWVQRMEQALPAFDVFALTSVRELFGNVLVEAMASGLPVVATDVGGIPEVVEDGETGLLAPAGDAEGVAERLLRLRRDAALRRKFGEAGRRRAVAKFSLDEMAAQYEALYLECLAAGKGGLK